MTEKKKEQKTATVEKAARLLGNHPALDKFNAATTMRADALRELAQLLRQQADKAAESPADFQHLFSMAARLLEVTDRDIGDFLGHSAATIQRWRKGHTTPPPLVKRHVLSSMSYRLEARLQLFHRNHPETATTNDNTAHVCLIRRQPKPSP